MAIAGRSPGCNGTLASCSCLGYLTGSDRLAFGLYRQRDIVRWRGHRWSDLHHYVLERSSSMGTGSRQNFELPRPLASALITGRRMCDGDTRIFFPGPASRGDEPTVVGRTAWPGGDRLTANVAQINHQPRRSPAGVSVIESAGVRSSSAGRSHPYSPSPRSGPKS